MSKHDIVAIITKSGIVTNRQRDILDAIDDNNVREYLDRTRMQFMAAFDLGQNWRALANSPTLFVVETDDNGELVGVFPPEIQQMIKQ